MRKLINALKNMFGEQKTDIGGPKTPEKPEFKKKEQTLENQKKEKKKGKGFFGRLEEIDKATDECVEKIYNAQANKLQKRL